MTYVYKKYEVQKNHVTDEISFWDEKDSVYIWIHLGRGRNKGEIFDWA